MTVPDSLVLRSARQTLVITRSLVPTRAAHMRLTGSADLRAALHAHLGANAVSALDLSAFWVASGGQPISMLRTAELVAAITIAVDAGRLRAYVFREPAYISSSDFQALQGQAEQAARRGATASPSARGHRLNFAEMDVADRFVEVFRRTIPRVGPEMGRQLRDLVENPAQLALMVGTIIILAQLHAVAAGEVIDGIVLAAIIACAALEGMGAIQALVAALETVGHIVDFIMTTLRARDEKDLDRAADKLAAGLSLVGVTLLTATFERIAGRFTNSLKKIGGQRKIEDVHKGEMAVKGKGAATSPPPSNAPPGAAPPVSTPGVQHEGGPIRWGPATGEGPLGQKLASTFRGGSYTERRLEKPTTYYRAHGGAAEEIGAYWTQTPPSGPLQSKMDSALLPEWGNAATSVTRIEVPSGTKIYEGFAAPQKQMLGGGSQVIIPKVDPSWVKK